MAIIEEPNQKRKNGLTAAGLNFLLPGAGYIYCGRIFLGIIVLPFTIGMAFFGGTMGALTMWVVLVIDGFLAAGRYNKRLDEQIAKTLKGGV